jgi:hypothetical protein
MQSFPVYTKEKLDHQLLSYLQSYRTQRRFSPSKYIEDKALLPNIYNN